jgi:hypothetical protein
MIRTSALTFAAVTTIASVASAAVPTLSAMTTFGGTDGWRAPNEVVTGDLAGTQFGSNYGYLGTGSLERGMGYDPVANKLYVVSRQNPTGTDGNNIRILNAVTGADEGGLNKGTGIVTGGAFLVNQVNVADDGAIYVNNLSTSATAAFKVYRWANNAATPTTAFNLATGLARTGDSFAVYGSGTGTKMAAAGTNNVAASNFAALSTVDGLNYTHTSYTSIAGTLTASNDYRLALTFIDSDTLLGNQGANVRRTDFAATATVTATVPVAAAQRPMDYLELGTYKLLAIADTNSSLVQILDISVPATPVLLASGNLTVGTLTANGNGTGSVQWGSVNQSTLNATLYVMSSNQGIQAFNFSIPEPTTLAAVGGVAMLGLRRRK